MMLILGFNPLNATTIIRQLFYSQVLIEVTQTLQKHYGDLAGRSIAKGVILRHSKHIWSISRRHLLILLHMKVLH